MAKTPAKKKGPAPRSTVAPRGRPAGLFTWIAVGLVLVVVVGLVVIKVTSGGTSNSGAAPFQPADPATVSELTNIPASVFNTIGVTSPKAPVTPPQAIKGQPPLEATNANGKKVPEILYIGGEFCPYCAAERWAIIIALSRFGTWTGLGNMSSYSGDAYPNTPTFTFVHAKYHSKYLVFKGVEMYADYIDPTTNFYAPLQKLTAQETAIITKYESPKYTKNPTSSGISFPFMTFANKFLVLNPSYSPDVFGSPPLSRSAVAAGLSDPTNGVTVPIIAVANYQTAAICSLTHDQPSTVCTSPGVKAAKKAMGL